MLKERLGQTNKDKPLRAVDARWVGGWKGVCLGVRMRGCMGFKAAVSMKGRGSEDDGVLCERRICTNGISVSCALRMQSPEGRDHTALLRAVGQSTLKL